MHCSLLRTLRVFPVRNSVVTPLARYPPMFIAMAFSMNGCMESRVPWSLNSWSLARVVKYVSLSQVEGSERVEKYVLLSPVFKNTLIYIYIFNIFFLSISRTIFLLPSRMTKSVFSFCVKNKNAFHVWKRESLVYRNIYHNTNKMALSSTSIRACTRPANDQRNVKKPI
jgi:hypothetical protein